MIGQQHHETHTVHKNIMVDVEQAIGVFYHSENSLARQEAHKYLLDIQRSSEGWKLCWNLLDENKSEEIQYYGAVILHSKLLHNFTEIPSDSLNQIRESILELSSKYFNKSKLLFNKLCTCFAVVTILAATDDFNLTSYNQQIDHFFLSKKIDSRSFILEFLTCLPQQFQCLHLTSTQRITTRTFFTSYFPQLLDIGTQILSEDSNNSDTKKYQNSFLSCLLAWIEIGVTSFPETSEKLFQIIFSKVIFPDLSDKAFQLLIELISTPSSFNCENTIFKILELILQLEGNIIQVINEKDETLMKNFCLLLTCLGETHCSVFIKTNESHKQQLFFRMIKLLFQFTSMEGNFPVDETCSELTFSFWFSLQDALISLDIDLYSPYHIELTNAYNMLLQILYVKCQLPSEDCLNDFTGGDKERLRCYRIDVQDTMLYVYTMLHDKSIHFFNEKLQQLINSDGNVGKWREYEVCFHLLKGLVEAIDAEESSYIPNILSLMSQVPKHEKVFDSLVLFLGALSDWLRHHPEAIHVVLPFLLEGLVWEKLTTQISCSIALKEICLECCSLFDSATMIPSIIETCLKVISKQSIPLKVVARLYSICALVLFVLPFQQMSLHSKVLVQPLYTSLKKSIELNDDASRTKRIVHYLNCYVSIFQGAEHDSASGASQVIMSIFTELLPLLESLVTHGKNEPIVDSVSLCIEKALPLGENETLIVSVCRLLVLYFENSMQASLISAATKVTVLFGKIEHVSVTVYKLFETFTEKCLSLSQKAPIESNVPDCMENFMEYALRIVKLLPSYIFENNILSVAIVRCALTLLNFQELPVIKKSCGFLAVYINESINHEVGKQTFVLCGRDIFIQCLACISGVAPRHTTDHFADIILAINKNYVSHLASWLNELFLRHAFPTEHVTVTQKEHFKKAILRERVNKRKVKEITKEFALQCRGFVTN